MFKLFKKSNASTVSDIDSETGLPFAPDGYYWYLRYNKEGGLPPYILSLCPNGARTGNGFYTDTIKEFGIVYVRDSNRLIQADKNTITNEAVIDTARWVLKHYQEECRSEEIRNSESPVPLGAYPPNKLGASHA